METNKDSKENKLENILEVFGDSMDYTTHVLKLVKAVTDLTNENKSIRQELEK